METKNDDHKAPKRKKANFLSRLGQRISKAFTKSKLPNVNIKNSNEGISKSCLDDLPVTSKSHDNLKATEEPFKTRRKKFGSFLRFSCLYQKKKRIPQKSDRCLSEGDLTRDEDKFYSGDSSPKSRKGRKHDDSIENDTSLNDSHNNSDSILKDPKNFKNELALKLKNKNPPKPKKDDESDSSKTPDSPPGNCTGTSPTRQVFNGSRTPYSMSSLSHSSNSLISGNTANNYGTSDGESMSRSVIDSTDDIGIVVDLATPINKTTTASLLDSTAARQKIAASRPRRARPKANDHTKSISGDKLKDSGKFSPVRDKRDILEEISEEDSQAPSNSPTSTEEDLLDTSLVTETKLKSTLLSETTNSSVQSSPLDYINPNDNKDVPFQISPKPDLNMPPRPVSDPSSVIDVQPSGCGDSILKSMSHDNSSNKSNEGETKKSSHSQIDETISNFKTNKMKFEDQEKVPRSFVSLRPVNTRLNAELEVPNKEGAGYKNKCTSWAPTNKIKIEPGNELKHQADDQIDLKLKINRYTPISTTKNQHILNNPSCQAIQKDEENDKRNSRVFDMIKNLENSVH